MKEIEIVGTKSVITVDTEMDEEIEFKLLTSPFTIQRTTKLRLDINPETNSLKNIKIRSKGTFDTYFYQDLDHVQLLSISEWRLMNILERKVRVFMLERKLDR